MDSTDSKAVPQRLTGFSLTAQDWAAILGVALLCVTGAGASAWLYLEEIRTGGNRGMGAPLARMEKSELKVRRKPGNSFVWSYVQEEESLYRKDSVQTSAGSAASIQFNDGSKIELGENSLIVIDDISNLALNFKQGTIVVKDKEGNDTQISVDKEGKKKVEKLAIRLTQPEAFSERWVPQSGKTPVRFGWQQRGGMIESGDYRVEISTDRSFRSALTQSVEVKEFEKNRELTVNLAPGAYHWRITRNGQALTTVGRFKLMPAMALKPTYPAPEQKLTFWSSLTSVQFRWIDPTASLTPSSDDPSGDTVEHRIEVARDPEFKFSVATQNLPSGTQQVRLDLPLGRYYWRLSSKFGAIQTSSAPQSLICEAGKRFDIQLALPEDRATLEMAPQFRLTWVADPSITDTLNYEWQVRDSSGKATASGKTTGYGGLWKSPAIGTFQWRVQASNANGEVLGESGWRTITLHAGRPLALTYPATDEKILYWDQPTEFDFKWEPDPALGEGTYEFEVSAENAFQKPLLTRSTRETSLASHDLKLAPGSYHWRLRLKDKEGNIVKTSTARAFHYAMRLPLAAPVPKAPAAMHEFSIRESDFETTFSWNPVAEAKQYDITVYRLEKARAPASGTTRKVVHHAETRDTQLELKDLPPGNYQWTLRSFDQRNRPGEPMTPRSFRVTEGAILAAPEDVSVEVQ